MPSIANLPSFPIAERLSKKLDAPRVVRLARVFIFLIACAALAPLAEAQAVVSVTATRPIAGQTPGVFTIQRTGDASQPLSVSLSLSGTATANVDYAAESSAAGALPPAFAPGKVAQAFSFDGQSQHVQASDDPKLDPTEEATVDAWVFFNQLPSASGRQVMMIADKSDFGADFLLDVEADNRFHFSIGHGRRVASTTVIQTGRWYHVAATYKALTEIKIYVNGALENTLAIDERRVPSNGVPFAIGRTFGLAFLIGPSYFSNGLIDEVHVFNRVLSDAEIRSIFAADAAGLCKPAGQSPNCAQPPAGLVGWFAGDGDARNIAENIFSPGKVAQAFAFNAVETKFNGTGEYVQYPSNAIQDPTTEATVDAWVYFNRLPSEVGHFMTIIDKSVINQGALSLLALSDNKIGFFSGFNSVLTNTVMQKGRWYHIAATFKANVEMRMYVNGVLENTQPISGGRAANDNPLTIGNSAFDRVRLFNGLIDEAQMYNRALSTAEIQAIFNADSIGLCKPIAVANCVQPPAGLVGWWTGDGNARDLITGARGALIGYDNRLFGQQLTFAAGQTSITVNIRPLFSQNSAGKTVVLTLLPDAQNSYTIDAPKGSAIVALLGRSASTEVSLSEISPNEAGNAGLVTTVISGQGFKPGVTVKLVSAGQQDIPAVQATAATDEFSVVASFDLTGVAPGVYDVVVANAGGTAKTLARAFTVRQGGAPNLSVDILGRNIIRGGREQTYTILYNNSGNVDAYAVPVYVTFPKFLSWQPGFRVLRPLQPPTPPNTPPLDFDKLPRDVQIGDKTLVTLFVPVMKASSYGTLPIILKLPDDPELAHVEFDIEVSLGPPLYDPHTKRLFQGQTEQLLTEGIRSLSAVNGMSSNSGGKCTRAEIDLLFNLLGLVPGVGCAETVGLFLANSFADNIATVGVASAGGDPQAADIGGDVFGSALYTLATCAGQSIPGFGTAVSIIQIAQSINSIKEDCKDKPSGKKKRVEAVTSNDPNDKVGSDGAGANHYVAGEKLLPYAIYFENKETATAPAQDVTVTDQLDPSKVDLSTFSFGAITFGARRFMPPAGQKSFVGYVDLRPEKSLLVKITANLNPATGLVTWTFNSLDAASGKAPDDPLAGFLPPNRTSPEGEGSVTFTVMPKASLVTDTPVTNTARIVFDVNAPIDTAVHLNTIDKTPPVSRVGALAATQPTHSFEVNWPGTDTGSGVGGYNVFVSENGGPFTLWQPDATATSAIYYGRANTTYRFYSIAFDLVGNEETAKTVAEATTQTPAGNPIDDPRWFVRQQYLDFLNREPDASGLQFWTNEVESCGANAQCREAKRINVSAAFFLSIEFQNTGYLVYRFYKTAYGDAVSPNVPGAVPIIRRSEFLPDTQRIGRGVVVLAPGWEQLLEANKQAFALEFVQRQRFLTAYPLTMTPAEFVDKLNQNAGAVISQSEREGLVAELSASTDIAAGRASVLRKVAESQTLQRNEFNRAFVLMQYYGYLRRNPDDPQDADFRGWKFWLDKLNSFGGNFVQAEMVKAFLESIEYRQRFTQ
jgi:hypothetical protein